MNTTEDKNSSTKTAKRNFNAAPTKTLNLSNATAAVTKKDWVSKADIILKSAEKNKETKRQRKKRLWLEKKEAGFRGSDKKSKDLKKIAKTNYGDWANLPDLVLEMIFQYLPFEVCQIT